MFKTQLIGNVFHKDRVIHSRDETIHENAIDTYPKHNKLDQSEGHYKEYHDYDSIQKHDNREIDDEKYVNENSNAEN